MEPFWLFHKISIGIFLFVIFIINLSNLISLKGIKEDQNPKKYLRVSICVPVRDEKDNIEPCLKTLISQEYPNFEIIVLHDDGDSEMEDVLSKLSNKDKKIKIIKGKPKPDNWIGKHWACHQMAKIADGQLLLFTDADTRHHPNTLKNAVAAFIKYNADFLSAIPKEEVRSFGEKLIVPIMSWSIHTFYPIGIAQRLKNPRFSLSVGQYMLIKNEVYLKIGGHEAIKQELADDITLGKRILAHGFNWRLMDGSKFITCRMYRNSSEAYEGFSRSLFPGFNYNYAMFIFVWNWLLLIFIEPFVVIFYHFFISPLSELWIYFSLYEIGISLLIWSISYIRFRFPFYMIFFYPLTIILAWIISIKSIYIHKTGKVKWKGRKIMKRKKSIKDTKIEDSLHRTPQEAKKDLSQLQNL
ncbi:MAG: glycosyltransferase [Candidatus Hodarchaeota archaeon]